MGFRNRDACWFKRTCPQGRCRALPTIGRQRLQLLLRWSRQTNTPLARRLRSGRAWGSKLLCNSVDTDSGGTIFGPHRGLSNGFLRTSKGISRRIYAHLLAWWRWQVFLLNWRGQINHIPFIGDLTASTPASPLILGSTTCQKCSDIPGYREKCSDIPPETYREKTIKAGAECSNCGVNIPPETQPSLKALPLQSIRCMMVRIFSFYLLDSLWINIPQPQFSNRTMFLVQGPQAQVLDTGSLLFVRPSFPSLPPRWPMASSVTTYLRRSP